MTRPVPIPDSYWVVDGRFLAGEYPRDYGDDASREKLDALLDAGIRLFIDLTHDRDPLKPYADIVRELAADRGIAVECLRTPVRDLGVPTPEVMRDILARIGRAIAENTPVYVHCWGGIGRTGTVVGCWLAENGYTGEEAIGRIAELRQDVPGRYRDSPETPEQHEMVVEWGRGTDRATKRATDRDTERDTERETERNKDR